MTRFAVLGFTYPFLISYTINTRSNTLHKQSFSRLKKTNSKFYIYSSKIPPPSTEVSSEQPTTPSFRTVPFPTSAPNLSINPRYPIVIIPGYGADAAQYLKLRDTLASFTNGHVSVVPVRWYDWGRTLGGRPVNLILDLIEEEVQRVVGEGSSDSGHTVKINLVGHSAGGWVARLWMGNEVYEGGTWGAKGRVAALVCLGTPQRSSEVVTKRNMGFVNRVYPGCCVKGVRYVCIGGLGCRVSEKDWWKVWSKQWFAKVSYELTAGKNVLEGDGVVPVEVAGLHGAENVMIEGVWHSPTSPGPWYGEEQVAQFWAQYLL